MRLILLSALFFLSLGARGAVAETFSLPLDCEIGQICIVQNYVDLDPGPGVRDPMCGPLTYDGHDAVSYTHLTLPTKRIV